MTNPMAAGGESEDGKTTNSDGPAIDATSDSGLAMMESAGLPIKRI